MSLRAGPMRHEIAIQTRELAADSFGEMADEVWGVSDPIQAAVRTIMGGERIEGLRTEAEVSHEVRIRYIDIDSHSRILFRSSGLQIESVLDMPEDEKRTLFGSRLLHIKSIANFMEKDEQLVLFCGEVA